MIYREISSKKNWKSLPLIRSISRENDGCPFHYQAKIHTASWFFFVVAILCYIMALTPPTDHKMRLEFGKSIKPDAEIQTTCDWHFGLVGRGTNISPEINESASELFNTFSDPKNILNKIVMKWALVPINFHCGFLGFLKIETFQHFRIMKFNQLAVWILAW